MIRPGGQQVRNITMMMMMRPLRTLFDPGGGTSPCLISNESLHDPLEAGQCEQEQAVSVLTHWGHASCGETSTIKVVPWVPAGPHGTKPG